METSRMDFRYKSHPRSTMYYESRISIIMITSSHFSSFSEVKSSLQRLYRDVLNFQCVCLFFKLNSFTTINFFFFAIKQRRWKVFDESRYFKSKISNLSSSIFNLVKFKILKEFLNIIPIIIRS